MPRQTVDTESALAAGHVKGKHWDQHKTKQPRPNEILLLVSTKRDEDESQAPSETDSGVMQLAEAVSSWWSATTVTHHLTAYCPLTRQDLAPSGLSPPSGPQFLPSNIWKVGLIML